MESFQGRILEICKGRFKIYCAQNFVVPRPLLVTRPASRSECMWLPYYIGQGKRRDIVALRALAYGVKRLWTIPRYILGKLISKCSGEKWTSLGFYCLAWSRMAQPCIMWKCIAACKRGVQLHPPKSATAFHDMKTACHGEYTLRNLKLRQRSRSICHVRIF